jgi:hypothetical protein
MWFSADQWSLLIIGFFVIIIANVIIWLLVLREHQRNREHVNHVITHKSPPRAVLTARQRTELSALARQKFEESINSTGKKLSADLTATGQSLNRDLNKLATTVVKEELEAYRQMLADSRAEAAERMGSLREEMNKQRQAAERELRAEVKTEKAELMAKFDTRLAEVLAAYLVESLGQNVDLGAQTAYIFRSLNEHKKQLKDDVLNDF